MAHDSDERGRDGEGNTWTEFHGNAALCNRLRCTSRVVHVVLTRLGARSGWRTTTAEKATVREVGGIRGRWGEVYMPRGQDHCTAAVWKDDRDSTMWKCENGYDYENVDSKISTGVKERGISSNWAQVLTSFKRRDRSHDDLEAKNGRHISGDGAMTQKRFARAQHWRRSDRGRPGPGKNTSVRSLLPARSCLWRRPLT